LGSTGPPDGEDAHIDIFRTADALRITARLPLPPHWLDLDGLRMHYVDEGSGAPVLLLHGEPTWSFLWRHVIPRVVASGRRAMAPDLIGFGRSDKPTDTGWYTYDRHVDSVTRLVVELDLRDLALVVHDWGGLIGLRFAVENAERVEGGSSSSTPACGRDAPSGRWLRFREAVRSVGGRLDIARSSKGHAARPQRRDPRRVQRPFRRQVERQARSRSRTRPRRARTIHRGGARAIREAWPAGQPAHVIWAPRTPSCQQRSPSASSR
jgi:pimeloyl-ACP methyl ester carboxylesterase